MLDGDDRARTAFVKHFYEVDPAGPGLLRYLVTGATAPSAAAMIVAAARRRPAGQGGSGARS